MMNTAQCEQRDTKARTGMAEEMPRKRPQWRRELKRGTHTIWNGKVLGELTGCQAAELGLCSEAARNLQCN